MLLNVAAVAAACAFTSILAAPSGTLVSFYSDESCSARLELYDDIPGDNFCHQLHPPGGTAGVASSHGGTDSCITYWEGTNCDGAKSDPIYLPPSASTDTNRRCQKGGDDVSFIPKSASVNDDTAACKPNRVTIRGYLGPGAVCFNEVGSCHFDDFSDDRTAVCKHIHNSAGFRLHQTANRFKYKTYSYVDVDCNGPPDGGPFTETEMCYGQTDLGCVRVVPVNLPGPRCYAGGDMHGFDHY